MIDEIAGLHFIDEYKALCEKYGLVIAAPGANVKVIDYEALQVNYALLGGPMLSIDRTFDLYVETIKVETFTSTGTISAVTYGNG